VIDDEQNQREILADILSDGGYKVITAASGEEGISRLKDGNISLVLTDLKMPGMDGLEVLNRIREMNRDIQVILMTAFGTIPSAVNAIKNGAYDYLSKPFNKEDLLRVINRAVEKVRLIQENRQLKDRMFHNYGYHQLIGASGKMQEIFRLIDKIKNVDASVLITGESGTGKELVARAIHFSGNRQNAPFVAINCAAIPETLIESELFGYEKGAFTGATTVYPGKFEQAQGGTIFLDEIGAMPVQLQPRLLRVLQEKKINKIGSNKTVELDVRIISATNENLNKAIQEKQLRIDLFHRLNIFEINVPPLRSRKKDIEILTQYFLEKFGRRYSKDGIQLTDAGRRALKEYHFPGNIRELENMIEKAVLLTETNHIDRIDLFAGHEEPTRIEEEGQKENLPLMEREMIVNALRSTNGSIIKAANKLGITYKTLQYRINKFELDKNDFKE
jgi:DNA-binding NtrC family response regulator